MHTPMFSFIMPCYKRQFLGKAIESILAQTYDDFELVVVNDASPENLYEVVNSISDPRLRYEENITNLGAVIWWLAGIIVSSSQEANMSFWPQMMMSLNRLSWKMLSA